MPFNRMHKTAKYMNGDSIKCRNKNVVKLVKNICIFYAFHLYILGVGRCLSLNIFAKLNGHRKLRQLLAFWLIWCITWIKMFNKNMFRNVVFLRSRSFWKLLHIMMVNSTTLAVLKRIERAVGSQSVKRPRKSPDLMPLDSNIWIL